LEDISLSYDRSAAISLLNDTLFKRDAVVQILLKVERCHYLSTFSNI